MARIRYIFHKIIWAIVWRLEIIRVEGQRKGVSETGGLRMNECTISAFPLPKPAPAFITIPGTLI